MTSKNVGLRIPKPMLSITLIKPYVIGNVIGYVIEKEVEPQLTTQILGLGAEGECRRFKEKRERHEGEKEGNEGG